jgi:hypothetical protein
MFLASHDIGHLTQLDHIWLPDYGILKCRNMLENIVYQYIERLMHLLVFYSP